MNTNAATSLDRLHDIVAPAPVPWWPPAPGWYWVIAFAIFFAVVVAVKCFFRWQHSRYRREALAELARLEKRLKNSGDRAAALLALSELLKRTALTAFPREDVAALTGAPWFEFLDGTGNQKYFSAGPGAVLEKAIYDPRAAVAFDEQKLYELTTAVRHWIKNHKAESKQEKTKAAKDSSAGKPLLSSFSSVQKT